MRRSLQHDLPRRVACAVVVLCLAACAGCAPELEHWTCDWDSSVGRPLSDPGAVADEAGGLPPSVCQNTCGQPVQSCTATVLDGGQPGAVCPRCTF